MQLVLASRNAHKLRELEGLLAPHRLEPLPEATSLPPETGATFAENALLKATAVAASTGGIAVADDSGIAVDALGGRPGVQSARFAGEAASDEDNLAKLVRDMQGFTDRRAAYVCVLAVVDGDATPRFFEGRCEGLLAEQPRGSGGFGYDPIFVPDEQEPGARPRTMAELSAAEKDLISHRGKAARALLAALSTRV
jgi:XTP/dITP diphosphohydrolase